MTAIKNIVEGESLSYIGLFKVKELYDLIEKWCYEMGYDHQELKNYQEHYDEGKQIIIEARPNKIITDYAKIEIRIFMIFSEIKDVEVERGGTKEVYNKGKLDIIFDLFLVTDWENILQGRPIYYFLRTLFDKFIYRSYTKKFERKALGDYEDIKDKIKGYLNMYKY